jgi:hypothetical protein
MAVDELEVFTAISYAEPESLKLHNLTVADFFDRFLAKPIDNLNPLHVE